MKFCPNCGNKLEDSSYFCSNCGNSLNKTKIHKSSINNQKGSPNVLHTLLSKPKIIGIILIGIILIFGVLLFFSGGTEDSFSNGGVYDMDIFGLTFHIPNQFVESYHSGPSSSGETVDFKTEGYDDLEIDVSPYYTPNLDSNHVKVKFSKTLANKKGIMVFYDSNRVSFYYSEGDYLVKINTNSPDHDEIFETVIG